MEPTDDDLNLKPSEVSDAYWPYAYRKICQYPRTSPQNGEWLIWVPEKEVDEDLRLHRVPSSAQSGVSHRDDDLSSGMSFFEIPERFSDLPQWVTSIDDRCYFAGLQTLLHETQILSV